MGQCGSRNRACSCVSPLGCQEALQACPAGQEVTGGVLEHPPSLSCSAQLAPCWCRLVGLSQGNWKQRKENDFPEQHVWQRLGGQAEHPRAPTPPHPSLLSGPCRCCHANFTQFLIGAHNQLSVSHRTSVFIELCAVPHTPLPPMVLEGVFSQLSLA